MADLHTLTAAEAARRIASGDLRSETPDWGVPGTGRGA